MPQNSSLDDLDVIARVDAVATALDELRGRFGAGQPTTTAFLEQLCRWAVDTVPGADMAGITLVDADGTATTPAYTDPRVVEIGVDQYRTGQGPCLEAAATHTVVRVRFDELPDCWPAFAAKATVLMARQVSDDDTGDTEFANTYAAYEELPSDDKAELEGVRVVHSFAASQLLVYPDPDPKERAAWDRNPSREHPLVWTRGSGKKSMVLGSTAERVVGRSEDESKELLTRLLEWSTQDRFTLRHKWRVGDVVIWDNTGMLHRACPYGEQSARLMLRTSLVGEEVVQ